MGNMHVIVQCIEVRENCRTWQRGRTAGHGSVGELQDMVVRKCVCGRTIRNSSVGACIWESCRTWQCGRTAGHGSVGELQDMTV